MGDLRTGQRIAFKTKAVVTWMDRTGNACSAIGECLDLSEAGMKVAMPMPLEVRTYVSVRCDAAKFHGSASVRSCAHGNMNYELGLEFTGGSKASPVAASAART